MTPLRCSRWLLVVLLVALSLQARAESRPVHAPRGLIGRAIEGLRARLDFRHKRMPQELRVRASSGPAASAGQKSAAPAERPDHHRLRDANSEFLGRTIRCLNDNYVAKNRTGEPARKKVSALRVIEAAAASPNPPPAEMLEQARAALVATTAARTEGRYYWAGPSGPDASRGYETAEIAHRPSNEGRLEANVNHFARWINGHGQRPGVCHGKMNCWQSTMTVLNKAGLLSYNKLVAMHRTAERAGRDAASSEAYFDSLTSSLNYGAARKLSATAAPRPGDLVFFNGLNHVAMALGTQDKQGRHEVMSLWIYPTQNNGRYADHMVKTTIEELKSVMDQWEPTDVRFAPPPR